MTYKWHHAQNSFILFLHLHYNLKMSSGIFFSCEITVLFTWYWWQALDKIWRGKDSNGSFTRLCHSHLVKRDTRIVPWWKYICMIKSKAKRSAAFDFMPVVQPSDRVGLWEAFIFHSTVDLKNEKPFIMEEWSFLKYGKWSKEFHC